MRVLITGTRAPVALELTRRFGRLGHQVHGADSLAFPLAGFSRYAQKNHRLPPPRQQPERFTQALRDLIERERIDLVIPTCEEVLWVAQAIQPFAPTFQQLQLLHNKWTFHQTARQLGLASPDSYLLEEIPQALERNWILKPVFSRFGTETLMDPKEIASLDIRPDRPWIAQRRVDGDLLCSYSVAHQGKLHAHVAYEPTLRLGGGAGVMFRSLDHPAIEKWVQHFVEQLGLSGQLSFDFIENETGVTALECNPRATSGAHLFESDTRLVEAFLGNGFYHCEPGRTAMLEGAALCLRPWAWARPVIADGGDPGPMFGQILSFSEMCLRSLRWHISILQATTRDIEWP